MVPPQQDPTRTDNRRRSDRRPLENSEVLVRFELQEIEGRGVDVSDDGILVTCAEECAVEVVVDGQTRRGRLVRVHGMPDGSSGLAVEFDPA